jgi:hypothetical protein
MIKKGVAIYTGRKSVGNTWKDDKSVLLEYETQRSYVMTYSYSESCTGKESNWIEGKVALEQARKAHRGSRRVALLFL